MMSEWLKVRRANGQPFVMEDKSLREKGFVCSEVWESESDNDNIIVFRKKNFSLPDYIGSFKKTDLEDASPSFRCKR